MTMRVTTDLILQKVRRIWSIRWIRTGLSMVSSLLVLAFLIYYASKSITELQQIWPQIKPLVLLPTLPVFILAILLGGFIWSNEVRYFGVSLSNWHNIRIYTLTLAARRLPGSFLHIISRVALYKKNGVGVKTLTFVSGLDIALTIWSGILVACTSLLLFNRVQAPQATWLILFFIPFTAFLNPKVVRFLFVKLTKDKTVSFISYRVMLAWLVGYIGLWVLGALILYLIIYAIYPLDPSLWLLALVAWSLSGVTGTIITFLPSGLGITEVTMSLILGQFMPSSVAVSVALLFRILLTFFDFLVSGVCWGFEKGNSTNGLLK